MCGTKSGAKGRLSVPRAHQISIREAGDRKAKPVRPPRLSDGQGTLLNGKPARKKSGRGVGVAIALLLALLKILFPAAEWLGDRVQDVGGGIKEVLGGYSDNYGEDTYGEDSFDGLVTEPLLKGQWHVDRADGGAMELDVDGDDRYALVIASPEGWALHESGTVTLWEELQEDGAYDDRYSPEAYDCYSLYLDAETLQFEPGEDGALPEGLSQYRQDGAPLLLLYREIAAPEGGFILYDYAQDSAPLFSSEPEQLQRKQAA